MTALVEVRDLHNRYRARDPWAVQGVTFALEPGRAFGLLGPNGAGKSTVVKAIVGLTRPDSGTVALFGERRQVRHFSKGMKQGLGLAQAILGRPKLLILDEPTADLDPIGRRDVRELIAGLKAQGTTVLLNSHLLSEVERVCDRVAIMARGRILEEGPMQELVPEGRTLEEVFMALLDVKAQSREAGLPAFMAE